MERPDTPLKFGFTKFVYNAKEMVKKKKLREITQTGMAHTQSLLWQTYQWVLYFTQRQTNADSHFKPVTLIVLLLEMLTVTVGELVENTMADMAAKRQRLNLHVSGKSQYPHRIHVEQVKNGKKKKI